MATLTQPGSPRFAKSWEMLEDTAFYSRNYGGFSKGQWEFVLAHAGSLRGKEILDPMGGQAFYLSQLAWQGYSVTVGDINPAPLLLAILRDPEMLCHADELRRWAFRRLAPLKKLGGKSASYQYIEDWTAPEIQHQLREYVAHFNLFALGSPISLSGTTFWEAPAKLRFASALPVLAARELTCFRSSDNLTWLKRGGLQRERSVYEAVLRALDRWCLFAQERSKFYSAKGRPNGILRAAWMDAERGYFSKSPKAHLVITSPAYANRLDYTRIWAPELAIVEQLFHVDSTRIKAMQIGSTVIRGKEVPSTEEGELPRVIQRALKEIRKDTANVASESYYYPFFANYAVSLKRMLVNIERRVRKGGQMMFFVRDNVRKADIFPTVRLISVMLFSAGWQLAGREKKVVRQHLGMRRRASRSGLYGFAQTEWWLAFRRKSL